MTPISTSSAEYKQFKEAFTQYAQYTAAVNNLRIFAEEQATQNLRQFVEENKESYKAHLQEEARQIAEKKAELVAKRVEIAARREQLKATSEQLDKEREDAEIKLAQAEAKVERGRALQEKGRALQEKGRALSKLADVRVFCTALGLPQPQENDLEKINQIASTYFPNGEIGDINGQITLFSMSCNR
ncbi:Uncharacterized protein NEOC65_000948 [Neochlamydia sp. AcF65]|uniref:hypothetical protein n=1 Tax=Neochlamydia sp. AcF65 TaxID=2795735 RepID=UPI001BCA04BC|nr:hypothetical protein [Neochlamydia sp. AcF65]MBS4165876.1 Uncharacterized protein [Neochlamydia sp. AcF65]